MKSIIHVHSTTSIPKKIYGVITLKQKGIKLVEKSILKMSEEFGSFKPNSIIHSDNVSELKSYQYKLLTMSLGLTPSMSRIGKSTDNGYIEGFWSTMKREAIVENKKYCNFDDYSYEIASYAKFYNTQRIKLKNKVVLKTVTAHKNFFYFFTNFSHTLFLIVILFLSVSLRHTKIMIFEN